MRIAFFSDIHANLPALEAFLKDVETEKIDAIYCLGDLIGYNVWPNEVVNEIRKRKISTIMGNHDEALLFANKIEKKPSNRSITKSMLTQNNIDYLVNLPRHLSLNFVTSGKPFNFLLVHGSPKAINDYMVYDYPEKEVLNMMQSQNTDVLLCGHTHKPFHRVIQDRDSFKHVINIGSLGKPKDRDPRICYAIVELSQNSIQSNKNAIKVSFKRVDYNIEKAAKAIENSAFNNAFAQALRVAK